jgi:hypothetical protein
MSNNGNGSYTQTAMLVKYTERHWPAMVTDQKISEDVAAQHSNDKSMGKYQKNLIGPGGCPEFTTCKSEINAGARLHRANTLPYADNIRLLTAKHYSTYQSIMQPQLIKTRETFDRFYPVYPQLIEDGKAFLNGAFRLSDYPPIDEIEKRFYVGIQVLPLPEGDDLRVSIPNVDMDALRGEVNADVASAIQNTVWTLYTRVYDTLNDLKGKLSTDKALRQQSINGALRMLDTADALNLTNDSLLTSFSSEIRAEVQGWTVQDLNKETIVRATALATIENIQETMSAFL